jgi:hypothetical protein
VAEQTPTGRGWLQMRYARITGLSLLGALALSAAGAGSASALPEVGRCVAQAGGKYVNASCTTKGKPGTFEFLKNAVKKGFTGTNLPGKIEFEGQSGTVIACTAESIEGEYLEKGTTPATKEVHHVLLTFKGCEIPLFKANCENTAELGEIVTKKLKGPLKYISGKGTKKPVVGQLLSPEAKNTFAAFNCPGVGFEAVIEGGVIGTYGTVNLMSVTNTLTFGGSTGVQEPQHFEGETKIHNLKVDGELIALQLATEVVNEEALEIKA